MNDEDFEEYEIVGPPSYPWAFSLLLGSTMALVSDIAASLSDWFGGNAMHIVAHYNHKTERRYFEDEARLDIDSIAEGNLESAE